ncbi:MAG: DUF4249 domain-containing protein [Bacteroidales bacterium]|nr:DUF4249 domain-containing protein [Bacteroidales bacterium]
MTLFIVAFLAGSCVTQFMPEITGEQYAIVIEGQVTDRNEIFEVRISWSQPLNPTEPPPSISNFNVAVIDDAGNEYPFTHAGGGLYLSDSLQFRSLTGRKYRLQVEGDGHFFESDYMKLIPVPEIDSLDADLEYNEFYYPGQVTPGYQVYVNTYDPTGECIFFRWDFRETWEFRLPWNYHTIINRICWKSTDSKDINIKSTSVLAESRITDQPVTFITPETDRLTAKYSILVRQYSLNEEEFIYWENIRKVAFDAGGLYDVVPSSIPSNIYCIDDPAIKVLGFFSVSGVAEKRLFIENYHFQFPAFYESCPFDTILVSLWDPIIYKDIYILTGWSPDPSTGDIPLLDYYVLSKRRECADCSMNGSTIMPDYWNQPGHKKVYHSLFNDKEK